MRGFDAQRRLGVEAALRYEGACRIPGRLWDLGPYPGLTTEGRGAVAGEVFSVLDDDVLDALDVFEGPEYERRRIRLMEPAIEAWVYALRSEPHGRKSVASGCWRTHALRGGELQSD